MDTLSLGDQELEVLRFVADHAPITTGEVAERFASTHGLARSTLLTVLERLRKKGYLRREKRDGVYHYLPSKPGQELFLGMSREVAKRLIGDSLAPFAMYLLEHNEPISPEEMHTLEELVQRMKLLGAVNK